MREKFNFDFSRVEVSFDMCKEVETKCLKKLKRNEENEFDFELKVLKLGV